MMSLYHRISRIFHNRHFLSLLSNLLMSALSFLTFADMARQLTKAEFGNWITFLAMITLAEVIRTSAIYTPLIKYIAGSTVSEQRKFSGAGWVIAFSITVMLIGVDIGFIILFGKSMGPDWILFSHWFPLVFVLNLPVNFAFCQLQAQERFSAILFLRILNNGLFLVFVLVGVNLMHGGVANILVGYLLGAGICSLTALLLGWAPLLNVLKTDRVSIESIFHMSKYVMVTGVSSNLLRSSDTLLINAFMGPKYVALYKTPEKILELIELPIRTLAGTAIPEMARALKQQSPHAMGLVMMRYAGIITLLLLPIIVTCFVLAPLLMWVIGGPSYLSTANLLRIFLFYALLLPVDRFLGISLDILGKPHLNLIKTLSMLGVNVAGDLLCLHYFGTIHSVAANSIITFAIGVLLGHYMLKRYVHFSYRQMAEITRSAFEDLFNKWLKRGPLPH